MNRSQSNGKIRSSPWAEAIEAGGDRPAGIVCAECGCSQPPIYYGSNGDRPVCFDCNWWQRPAREEPSDASPLPSPLPAGPRIVFPDLDAAELAALNPAARRVYLGTRAGLSYAEIGRQAGVSQESVGQAARRLLAALQRARLEG